VELAIDGLLVHRLDEDILGVGVLSAELLQFRFRGGEFLDESVGGDVFERAGVESAGAFGAVGLSGGGK